LATEGIREEQFFWERHPLPFLAPKNFPHWSPNSHTNRNPATGAEVKRPAKTVGRDVGAKVDRVEGRKEAVMLFLSAPAGH